MAWHNEISESWRDTGLESVRIVSRILIRQNDPHSVAAHCLITRQSRGAPVGTSLKCELEIQFNPAFTHDSVVINIRFSKTDQMGHGQEIEIAQTGTKYDACRWLRVLTNLLREGRVATDLLWPWGANVFRVELRETLKRCGLTDVRRYSSHSFRRGGAQAAHRAGAADCEIKALGRWKSECYQQYVNVSGREAGRKIAMLL